ncbi:MAG: DUF951 domain-containing protein [Clostridia bacterium]
MTYTLGDIVQTKKPHPCGSNLWEVVRTGADIKLKCVKCGHIVMLSSENFKKAVVRKVNNENSNQSTTSTK